MEISAVGRLSDLHSNLIKLYLNMKNQVPFVWQRKKNRRLTGKKECKWKDLCLKTCLWENWTVTFTKYIWQCGGSCHLILSPEWQILLIKPKQDCSCKVSPLRPRWQTKRQLLANLKAQGTATGTLSSNALFSVPVELGRDLYRAPFTVSGELVGLSARASLQ